MYLNTIKAWICTCKPAHTLTCTQYTHLTASHVRFLQLSIRLKKRCRVVQNHSPPFSSCFHHPPFVTPWSWSLPFFFSSWVFMRGRLGAVIPVLYTTWHRPAVRPQRLVPTPDWTAILLRWCHQHPAGSGVKLFTLKAEEVKVTVATKSSFWESTTRL